MKIECDFSFPFGFYIFPTVVFEKTYSAEDNISSIGFEFSFRFLKFEFNVVFWCKIG